MNIIHQEKGNKSLDTLFLELEEKEIQRKNQYSEDTLLTESDIFVNNKADSNSADDFNTVVVRNNIKDKMNLKNLKQQIGKAYLNPKQTPKNQSEIEEIHRLPENKTTATTSQRKNLEIKSKSLILFFS